ncbi:multiple PDZ domain protein [Ixodes scapularis]
MDMRKRRSSELPCGLENAKSRIFTVELRKSSRGLGIGILRVGSNSNGEKASCFVRIHELYPQQPAQLSGQLQIGDVILKVNGVRLFGKSPLQALEILRATSGLVKLTIYRPLVDPNAAQNDSVKTENVEDSSEDSSKYLESLDTAMSESTCAPLSFHQQDKQDDNHSDFESSGSACSLRLQEVNAPETRFPPGSSSTTSDVGSSDSDHLVSDLSALDSLARDSEVFRDPGSDCSHASGNAGGPECCRRHKSVDVFKSKESNDLLGDTTARCWLERHASDMVRSCCNGVVFGDEPAGPGLTKWRGTVLSEDADESIEGRKDIAKKEAAPESTSASPLEIECVCVQLQRGWHTKLGFSLRNCNPHAHGSPMSPVVKAVHPGSLAFKDGRILPDDFLIQVNDYSLLGCTAKEAVDYIKRCGGTIRLLFIRIHKKFHVS